MRSVMLVAVSGFIVLTGTFALALAPSPYTGQLFHQVKALSPDDVADLEIGSAAADDTAAARRRCNAAIIRRPPQLSA